MLNAAFALKRAYYSTLRFSRAALEGTGLTQPRYDLLQVLWGQESGVGQKRLRLILGVNRSSVSEMLCALEELGYVRREIDPNDRRCKIVWLTEAGAALLKAAYDAIVKPGWVRFAFDWVLGPREYGDLFPQRSCHREMAELDKLCWAIRRGFADTGCLRYRQLEPGDRNRDSPPGALSRESGGSSVLCFP